MDQRISGSSSSYWPQFSSLKITESPDPSRSASSSNCSTPEGLSPRASFLAGGNIAPRAALSRLPSFSHAELQAEKRRVMERIQGEGVHFRSTQEDRDQFKLAYLSQHDNDIDEWETNAWDLDSLKYSSPELAHMPIEDMIALRAWTITPDYQIVQDVLEANAPCSVEGLAYAKCIVSALHSLPDSYSHQGTVFTGEDQSDQWVRQRYKQGDTVTNLRFFATSETKEAAWQGKRVEWETDSQSGKRISKFSFIKDEQEVLFPPGTQFKIDRIERSSHRPIIKIYQSEI
ncbi:type III secretion system effector XopAI [Xylophilus ampelinus]|nr:type III secretion system effector XopAI [Xylophilus ampelinus]MCS4510955.1 ADP-ribosyltransferase domain-containing protein [Xylophilus ampelinus]